MQTKQFQQRFKELVSTLDEDDFNTCAEKIGITEATFIPAYYFGEVPSTAILKRIAQYFNVSTDYLLGKTEQK